MHHAHVRRPAARAGLPSAQLCLSRCREDEEDDGRHAAPEPEHDDDDQCSDLPFDRLRAMASFNEKLVQEVKKHKQLWDQHSKLHKEAGYREAAWMDIAAALAVSVEECQTRWRTIRDTYLKRKKRRRADAKGQWNVLDRELGFLDDFLRPRTRRWTLRAAGPTAAPAEVEVKREQPDEDADVREAAAAEAAAVAAVAAAPPDPWALAVRPAAMLPHHLAAGGAAAQERASDPEELFCLSLAAHLKRLLPRERNMAKMKMLQTLHDFEFGENSEEVALGEP